MLIIVAAANATYFIRTCRITKVAAIDNREVFASKKLKKPDNNYPFNG